MAVFTRENFSALKKTCQGRTSAQRRDTMTTTVLTTLGIRAREAGPGRDPLRPSRPRSSDFGPGIIKA